jgi:hypothetical protein
MLGAGPSCEKFLPCAESSCGRVDKLRGQGLCEYEAHTSKYLGRQPKDPEAQGVGPTTQGQCLLYANLATMPDEKARFKAVTEERHRAIAMLGADQKMITIPSDLVQASLSDQYHCRGVESTLLISQAPRYRLGCVYQRISSLNKHSVLSWQDGASGVR